MSCHSLAIHFLNVQVITVDNRTSCHGFAIFVFFVNVLDNAVFVLGRVLFKRARVNVIAVFVFNITARRTFSYRRVLDIKVGSIAEYGRVKLCNVFGVFFFFRLRIIILSSEFGIIVTREI